MLIDFQQVPHGAVLIVSLIIQVKGVFPDCGHLAKSISLALTRSSGLVHLGNGISGVCTADRGPCSIRWNYGQGPPQSVIGICLNSKRRFPGAGSWIGI